MSVFKVKFVERIGSNDYAARYEYVEASSPFDARDRIVAMFSCRDIEITGVIEVKEGETK